MLNEVENLAACVGRGAALMDRTYPSWFRKVDLLSLDMNSCMDCIFGQMFGSYNDVLDDVEKFFPGVFNLKVAPDAFGFKAECLTMDWREIDPVYAELTRLWRVEIERRRDGTDR